MATAANTKVSTSPDGEDDNKPTGGRKRRGSITDVGEQEQPDMVAATKKELIAKLNDEARQRLFDTARTDIPPSKTLLHRIVHNSTECLLLSVAVDALSSNDKKKLFDACKDLPHSDKWEDNTFNYACDPDGYHEMASIKVDSIPQCFLKVDYIQSHQEEVYPEDLTECVRVFTLMQADEY
jgi:hypothetical protein